AKGRGHKPAPTLEALLAAEDRAGLYTAAPYAAFRERILRFKLELQRMLVELKREGRPAPGIGCPGRSSTLLNTCNIDPELMPYIAEQSTSLKRGLHLPGQHIPVVDEKRLFDEQPEYAVMLSWHYAAPIIKKMRERGLTSKIILPLPDVHVVEG